MLDDGGPRRQPITVNDPVHDGLAQRPRRDRPDLAVGETLDRVSHAVGHLARLLDLSHLHEQRPVALNAKGAVAPRQITANVVDAWPRS